MSHAFPHRGSLPYGFDGRVRFLGEHIEGLLEGLAGRLQVRLRLGILPVAVGVQFVSSSAHQRRREHAGDGCEHLGREVGSSWRRETELASGGLW